jgi:hypothetical protein
MQVLTVRIPPTVLQRMDALLAPLQKDRTYQLRGIEARSDVLRLVIEKGIGALEKELRKA